MKHYVVLAKSYTINEAGDETLDDVNLLTVEHFKGDIRNIRFYGRNLQESELLK